MIWPLERRRIQTMTESLRKILQSTLIVSAAIAALIAAAPLHAEDWPQWRGSGRDGVATASPALVDTLNSETLTKSWESEPIPGGEFPQDSKREWECGGGFSQPVIVGDRVYVLENHARYALTRAALSDLGWAQGMPEEFVKLAEAARQSDERKKLTNIDKEVVPWAEQWLKANLSGDREKFAPAIKARLVAGDAALPLETLAKLDAVADKEFVTKDKLQAWIGEHCVSLDSLKQAGFLPEINKHVAQMVTDSLWALDRLTGKTIYKTDFPGQFLGYPSSSTPCVENGRIYFHASDAVAYCIDAATGKKIWEAQLLKKSHFQHSRASSPLFLDGIVIVGTEMAVHGLDAQTGKTLWTNTTVVGEEASAAVCKLGDRTAILYASAAAVSSNGRKVKKLSCLDPKTGKELWNVATGWTASTPVVVKDVCVLAGRAFSAGAIAFKITESGATPLWDVEFKAENTRDGHEEFDNYASPVVDKGLVYIAGKVKLFCIELATGAVKWEQELKPKGSPRSNSLLSSSVFADGKILMSSGLDLLILRATAEKFDLLGSAKAEITPWSTPAFADGFLYVRTEKNVRCYDLRKK
jgi:outer membrane protein assembly factor BamB